MNTTQHIEYVLMVKNMRIDRLIQLAEKTHDKNHLDYSDRLQMLTIIRELSKRTCEADKNRNRFRRYLKMYGRHSPECDKRPWEIACECGWRRVKAKLKL